MLTINQLNNKNINRDDSYFLNFPLSMCTNCIAIFISLCGSSIILHTTAFSGTITKLVFSKDTTHILSSEEFKGDLKNLAFREKFCTTRKVLPAESSKLFLIMFNESAIGILYLKKLIFERKSFFYNLFKSIKKLCK